MQHHVADELDGHLAHSWGVVYKALLVLSAGFAVLIVSWIAYLALVAAIILWG